MKRSMAHGCDESYVRRCLTWNESFRFCVRVALWTLGVWGLAWLVKP